MRTAEARRTLAVVAARNGEPDQVLAIADEALGIRICGRPGVSPPANECSRLDEYNRVLGRRVGWLRPTKITVRPLRKIEVGLLAMNGLARIMRSLSV